MLTRRNFINCLGTAAGTALLTENTYAIPASATGKGKSVRFGLITDLHHLQFGQPEEVRLKGFMDSVMKDKPDFIIQCGDFCRPTNSDGIMTEWNRFAGPKYHVLGNHDMDVCDKATIMKFWGMPQPYYSFDKDGFHFVVMDRNFFRTDDGALTDYNTGNWGPSIQRSYSDQKQLEWLKKDLAETKNPVIIFMHQPVFLSDFFKEIGNADEILQIFDEANFNARKSTGRNKIAAVFMGHDHDDRHGERNGVHYFIINSASYVYTKGKAYFYKDPLYAFITLDPAGKLTLSGTSTEYSTPAPDAVQAKFPARISDQTIKI